MGCGGTKAASRDLTSEFLEYEAVKKKLNEIDPKLLNDAPQLNRSTTVAALRKEVERLQQLHTKHVEELDARTSQMMSESELHANNATDASQMLSLPPINKAESNVLGNVASASNVNTLPSAEMVHVEVDPKEDEDATALLGEENDHGLTWDTKWRGQPAGPRDESHRNKIRNGTKRKVAEMLGLVQFGDRATLAKKLPPHSQETTLFLDERPEAREGNAGAGGWNLLGRFDMVCVRAVADMDRDWNFMKGGINRPPFWVLHAAALNVGEHTQAPDFDDFADEQGVLNEKRYLDAMAQIYKNIIQASAMLDAQHVIFFPFGMGAFLRHLNCIDDSYNSDTRLQNLRRQLARRFMLAFEAAPPKLTLHLCLQFSSEEALRNADAFIRAVKAAPPEIRSRTKLWPEGDSLHLAHELAFTSNGVILVNGANRQMIGNHWFAAFAKRAIDENLHRRSWVLSAHAYMLNNFGGRGETDGTAEDRPSDELQINVNKAGGRCWKLYPKAASKTP
jgi:hypothetical protein